MNDTLGQYIYSAILLLGVWGVAALIIIGLLWLLMPLAIYGLKKRVDRQTAILRRISDQLQDITVILAAHGQNKTKE